MATTKTTLPQFAAFVLTSALENPGWAVTSRDHGAAFQLLETVLPTIKPPEGLILTTQRAIRDAAPEWATAPIELELTGRQVETIKKCLQSLRDKGALLPGWATFALLNAFELAGE